MEKTQFNIIFGKFIRVKRLDYGWSQADLATKLGHNYQNVSRLERGGISPTLFWCYSLADAFEMSFIQLIKEFEDFKAKHDLDMI